MNRLQNEPPPSRERDPPVAANLTITAIAAIKESTRPPGTLAPIRSRVSGGTRRRTLQLHQRHQAAARRRGPKLNRRIRIYRSTHSCRITFSPP